MTPEEEDLLKRLYIKADALSRVNGAALYKACLQLGPLIGRDPEELASEFETITKVQWNSINRDNPLNQV